MFDRQTQNLEEDRRYRRGMMWRQEEEINRNFRDNEEVRHYNDYHKGVPYSSHPAPTEWESLNPYDMDDDEEEDDDEDEEQNSEDSFA
ncbi:hypothetical protein L1987_02611 [Smallanthus sonchifolius]|uniref:Uncharacterized protein n=1 Tax=Smallanthus sonchifolius TaxID=185202 RepID=A0ACB9K892_9ASTR|nr:hypothetical protein L1987_02611 [Smallanthus sonchifolius]